MDNCYGNIADLLGKTLTRVDCAVGNDEALFECDDGTSYRMYHSQDCCENVEIEDITGDLADLIGSPIIVAEQSTSGDNPLDVRPETIEWQDSCTWTFYRLATAKGWVVIRWYGSSNGYYSESVTFEERKP